MYQYECLCGCPNQEHLPLCKAWNRRKEKQYVETGIERYFREQEEQIWQKQN